MSSKFLIPLFLLSTVCWSSDILKLSDAYEMALKNEPQLRALALRTASGKEQIEQSRSKLYPQLQGSFTWGQYGYQYTTPTSKPVKESYKSYSLSATQPLFHPEVWRGVDVATARQKSAEYEFKAKAQQAGLELAKAYFLVLYTQKNVELIQSHKAYYESKYKQLEEMLKVGLSNRIDLLETKVQRDKSTSEWLAEKKKFEVAKLKLEHLIGENVTEVQSLDFSAIDTVKFISTREEWENKLLDNPMFKSSLAAEETARHDLAVREYEHYPKVDLSISRKETYTQDQISHKYDNQAVAQMTVPIYQGGATESRIREGKLLLDSATQERNYYQKEAQYRFESLWVERQLYLETIDVLKESEKSAELFLQSVERGQSAGLKSVVDVLEAKAKLYEVRRQMIEAGYQLVNNQLGLLDITGTLNVDKIAQFETLLQSKDRISK